MVELHCTIRSSHTRWVMQQLQASVSVLINQRLAELCFQVDQCF
jgi:hypothetical protein